MRHAVLSRTFVDVLGRCSTLTARSLRGFRARPKGAARSVTAVIGLSLSIALPIEVQASIVPNNALKSLANKQLTDKQYQCHNEIVRRESSWNIHAIGNRSGTKQTHGYYQIKSESVKGKPYDYQFYLYWYYVASRYSFDPEYPDLPNYCAALNHLKVRGWQ